MDAGTAKDAGTIPEVPEARLSGFVVDGTRFPAQPPFDPDALRYMAIVQDPREPLEVTLEFDPRLRASISGSRANSGEPVGVPSEPSEPVQIEVANELGETRSYDLVVLPPDFPDLVVTARKPGASEEPIYVALRNDADLIYYLAKLDALGVPLFQRRIERPAYDFKKHPGGELSYAEVTTSSAGAEQVLLGEQFEEIRRVTALGLVNTDEHDFQVLANGNFITLSYEPSWRDMTAYGGTTEQRVDDAILQERTPEGDVSFQWNSWDHMAYEETRYHERDYAHVNSVFVEADGNWLVSSRGMSQVLKIDRATGEVLWRFGGISNEFTIEGDPLANLCGQHTASRTPEGHLLLFDNGQHCWPENPDRGETTRVVEFELDEERRAARLVWSYQKKHYYTYSQGSVQRLPNGNTFIGWGRGPRAMATEVDAEGNVVFEIEAAGGSVVSYRAWRFPD